MVQGIVKKQKPDSNGDENNDGGDDTNDERRNQNEMMPDDFTRMINHVPAKYDSLISIDKHRIGSTCHHFYSR